MFSSPQGEREAERPPGPEGHRHLSASSGAKHWNKTVECGTPPKNGMQDASKVAGPDGDLRLADVSASQAGCCRAGGPSRLVGELLRFSKIWGLTFRPRMVS